MTHFEFENEQGVARINVNATCVEDLYRPRPPEGQAAEGGAGRCSAKRGITTTSIAWRATGSRMWRLLLS